MRTALIGTDQLDDQQLAAFDRDGFVVVRGFWDDDHVASMAAVVANDDALRERALRRTDGAGEAPEIALWNTPGDDALGAAARSARLVGAVSQLLGDEPYHYHSKLNRKDPGSGGSWIWHQDYGYWYANTCLFPTMLTVGVPLSPMTTTNGALRLLAGSHHAGRIDHQLIGEQAGADPERVEMLVERCAVVDVVAEPGDAVFFHCNTLHCSGPNHSAVPRDLFLVAYNTRRNDPVRTHVHPRYTPIDLVADDHINDVHGTYLGTSRAFLTADD